MTKTRTHKRRARRTRKQRGGSEIVKNFMVNLFYNDENGTYYLNKDHIDKNSNKIVDWYTTEIAKWVNGNNLEVIRNPHVKHIAGNRFALYFNIEPEASEESIQLDLEALLDPDDDGNYPISINSTNYLVSGYAL